MELGRKYLEWFFAEATMTSTQAAGARTRPLNHKSMPPRLAVTPSHKSEAWGTRLSERRSRSGQPAKYRCWVIRCRTPHLPPSLPCTSRYSRSCRRYLDRGVRSTRQVKIFSHVSNDHPSPLRRVPNSHRSE